MLCTIPGTGSPTVCKIKPFAFPGHQGGQLPVTVLSPSHTFSHFIQKIILHRFFFFGLYSVENFLNKLLAFNNMGGLEKSRFPAFL